LLLKKKNPYIPFLRKSSGLALPNINLNSMIALSESTRQTDIRVYTFLGF